MSESKPINILYMEDNPGMARLFQKRLQRSGYFVDIARDGEKGLAMLAKNSYDILILDQGMPGYNGLEVIRILSSWDSHPPLVMVTGTGNEKIAVEAMKLGAVDYIVKDVDGGYLELLPTVIERVLHLWRSAEEKKQMEKEREELIKKLQDALAKVKTLSGFLPICSSCKNIRDDKGYWNEIENYIRDHSEAEFSHSLCPKCAKKLYPNLPVG